MGGPVASQGRRRRLVYTFLALGVSALCCALVAAEDILRLTYNVPGDSKAIVLHADEITTWVEGGQRIFLLKGKVLVEHGVVHARMQQAVAWVDLEQYRQTGIQKMTLYAEGNVTLENGPESRSGPKAVADLSTRGEIKLKAHNSKATQQPRPNDPLYRRGVEAVFPQVRTNVAEPIQRASFQEPGPVRSETAPALPVQGSVGPPPLGPAPPAVPLAPGVSPSPPPTATPPTVVPVRPGPAPPVSPPPGSPPPVATTPTRPPQTGARALQDGKPKQINIVTRSTTGFDSPGIRLPSGEYVIVVTGGVIVVVRNEDNSVLVDIEADRLVFWTRNNPNELLSNLRSQQGQSSRELEFYLSGNVEIRQPNGPETRVLRADEVFYDAGRSVAVALRGDLEMKQPGLTDPVHLKAEELLQLSPTVFKGVKAEIFSSRLPSDPGLKVYVAEATMEEKRVLKRSIFGRQVIDRRTGQPEFEQQRLFDSRNVFLELDDIPVFYLPFLRGDAHDPLGPVESVGFGYSKPFGAAFSTTLNVYDLLGIDPYPGTRWRMDLDYLTRRGPALGTEYDYINKEFLGHPARVAGIVKAYGINDTATDILGGNRDLQHHPDWRGRFLWRQNVQDLPAGFSVQSQISALSDKNFLEQYYKNEFDTDINQETFVYLKQQCDNWAWTVLTEPRIRNWVTETEWLPRADGYLIGHSLFNTLTYNAHASAGFAKLEPTHVPPPPVEITDQAVSTGRFDLMQELSLPFTLGPLRLVPYGVLDLTYYTEDLTFHERGRLYEGGGVRGSIPFTRLYPDVESELLNLNGINHKIVLSGNYYIAHSDTRFARLPQLDRLNDDATDQALRDIKPQEFDFNPGHGKFLAASPLFDPQLYAIRRLVYSRIDTLDSVEVVQADLRQRWQTKRGYPGQQHIVDWMTLDLSASYFPHSRRDNFGDNFAFLEYDWTWNIGDRTSLNSTGWVDPIKDGPRVFTVMASLNRPDRTNFTLGYREIDPLNSQAVIGGVTYVFSPKYAITFNATYDFGINSQLNSLVMTRMGTDLQVSLGFNYNSILKNFGVTFEILPNVVPPSRRGIGSATFDSMAFHK
jgi:hypothetical protein